MMEMFYRKDISYGLLQLIAFFDVSICELRFVSVASEIAKRAFLFDVMVIYVKDKK